ncbi:MAG TPA: DUF4845 domain-containing protein [Quisquiliibacterium sp.]|jgi:hypothetical protein|nr:DUF4845 domain-containing protein [Quisquiliibacterium sp.]
MTPTPAAARRQRGLSLIGMLFFGIIAVMLVVLGMRVMPSALEYFAIKRALTTISTSGVTSPVDVQRAFDRQAAIDDLTSITGRDLIVQRNGQQLDISFSYEKRVPLFGPASLLIQYEGSTASR